MPKRIVPSAPVPAATAPKVAAAADVVRQRLVAAVAAASPPVTLKQLSIALGRNHAYLQQYLKRYSPMVLPEDVRYKLAELLAINEAELRASTRPLFASKPADSGVLAIDFLAHPAHRHIASPTWQIGREFLVPAGSGGGGDATANNTGNNTGSDQVLKLVLVGDDAMKPEVRLGDIFIIDTNDTDPHRAGLFAIDAGDHIRVRFAEIVLGEGNGGASTDEGDGRLVVLRYGTSEGVAVKQTLASAGLVGRCVRRFSEV